MIFLNKLADLTESSGDSPPTIVWIFIAVWVLFMVGIPVIMIISGAREKRRKAEQSDAETRKRTLSSENLKPAQTVAAPARGASSRYDMRDNLIGTLSRINPELQQRLDDAKKTKELKKTQDTIQGSLRPHEHAEENKDGLYGSIDYCEFDDFFSNTTVGDISDGEIGDAEEHPVSFSFLSDEDLTTEEAAEIMILGDILNNPKVRRRFGK